MNEGELWWGGAGQGRGRVNIALLCAREFLQKQTLRMCRATWKYVLEINFHIIIIMWITVSNLWSLSLHIIMCCIWITFTFNSGPWEATAFSPLVQHFVKSILRKFSFWIVHGGPVLGRQIMIIFHLSSKWCINAFISNCIWPGKLVPTVY